MPLSNRNFALPATTFEPFTTPVTPLPRGESKSNADKLEADARGRAQSLDAETAERRTQLFGDLERERDALSHEVDNLRAFEREYRSRLKTYFSQQLEALETSGSADPTTHEAGLTQPKRLRSVLGDDEG